MPIQATTKMYEYLLHHPPLMPDGSRRIGAALYSNFWKGYDGLNPFYIVRGSFVYHAWRAGKAYKKNTKQRQQNANSSLDVNPDPVRRSGDHGLGCV
ncbi:hypothetical protein LCGC14_2946120 [marine sediment metagenome]|uniref:Uncharacterized protein n=1 Tax=marine sediment metagenome TaxID=412755 RepID=A0A0F8ZPB0_9ZZZZ